ncbi:hypothetical protein CPT03_10310 [Pedobacter ginsengisoli]|uniref:Uncharacterized protein n=2 Tax=Pedobacter ginsengisoli TaxID=363852 RepID=A0A2D1U5F5_9SPHI|nr:hypothetical protein CPT03_10310 [Pedobacter ginsengisoli]
MKLMKYLIKQPLLLAGGLLLLASCADSSKKDTAVKQSEPVAGKQKGQFVFYKDINIRPGINFEVVSWGKGVDSVGGYLILMSDSLKSNYKSFSNERNGIITDAWNMDLDNDGNPEIYIELLSKKNVHDLNVFEYSDGNFNKITFPALSDRAKKTYGGNDKFVIKNGDLLRTYPIVNSEDSTEKDGSLKTLQYRLSGNSFSISEVKE